MYLLLLRKIFLDFFLGCVVGLCGYISGKRLVYKEGVMEVMDAYHYEWVEGVNGPEESVEVYEIIYGEEE